MPSTGTLSVCAAMIPASHVPWPEGSVIPLEPSRIDVPGTTLPARSGCKASTPVSRSATLAVPVGVTFPKTWSQAILGSAHWYP